MSLKLSTGLRNALLDTASFRTIMNSCTLKIYDGAVPASADNAPTGTLLSEIFLNNDGVTGLTFNTAAIGGVIEKTTAEAWEGTNGASGTASYYRLELSGDLGTLNTTDKRVQGGVAVTGAELNLTSIALLLSASQKIDYYSIAIPTL